VAERFEHVLRQRLNGHLACIDLQRPHQRQAEALVASLVAKPAW